MLAGRTGFNEAALEHTVMLPISDLPDTPSDGPPT